MTITLGLGAALLYAGSDLAAVRAARRIGALLAFVLVLVLGVLPVAGIVMVLGHLPQTAAERDALGWAMLSGVFHYGGQLALFKGLKDGNVAVVAPIATLEGVVAFGIATGMGERVAALAVTGVVIAMAGAVMTALEPGGRTARGAGWGLLSALLFGGATVTLGQTGAIPVAATLAGARLGGVILLVLVVLVFTNGVPRSDGPTPWRWLWFAAVVELLAEGAAALSLTSGPISIASVCQSQYGTFSALLALVLLRERPGRTQVAGVAATGVGVALMALAA